MKLLLTALISFSFFGCAKPCAYPEIKTVPIIAPIDINVSHGIIYGKDTQSIIHLIRQLRKSESYYYEQVTKYNEEFVK